MGGDHFLFLPESLALRSEGIQLEAVKKEKKNQTFHDSVTPLSPELIPGLGSNMWVAMSF